MVYKNGSEAEILNALRRMQNLGIELLTLDSNFSVSRADVALSLTIAREVNSKLDSLYGKDAGY